MCMTTMIITVLGHHYWTTLLHIDNIRDKRILSTACSTLSAWSANKIALVSIVI